MMELMRMEKQVMKEKIREYEMMASKSESVAWEGDPYSQVMGMDKDGYVRGLGLGPTPKEVWGLASLSKWNGIRLTISNKETAGVKELCKRMDTFNEIVVQLKAADSVKEAKIKE
ncbi:hypothetical protein Ancab_039765 [Ancistrocladus abbreviatus]